jgi:hypothetical protein
MSPSWPTSTCTSPPGSPSTTGDRRPPLTKPHFRCRGLGLPACQPILHDKCRARHRRVPNRQPHRGSRPDAHIACRIPRCLQSGSAEIFSDTIVSRRHQSHISLRRSARRPLKCWVTREEGLGAVDDAPEVDVPRPFDVLELADLDVTVERDAGIVVDLVDHTEVVLEQRRRWPKRLALGEVEPSALTGVLMAVRRSSVTASLRCRRR